MIAYSIYCPIAKAAEILTERWTLLLLRDLLLGARHFNDFRRSIPLMTPAILSKRLKTLQEVGIVRRVQSDSGGGWEYRLTEAGVQLKPLVDAAGEWGQRWARSKLPDGELHPSTLIWDIHRFLKTENLPARRTVLHVEFTDLKKFRLWWLVIVGKASVDVRVSTTAWLTKSIGANPLQTPYPRAGPPRATWRLARNAQASVGLELAGRFATGGSRA